RMPGRIASGQERASPASGNEGADVCQRDRPLERTLIGHVSRHPLGIELLLVETHTLKVVPMITAAKKNPGQTLAKPRTTVLADRRQRRHSEIECSVARALTVEHRRQQEEIHQAGTVGAISHEID